MEEISNHFDYLKNLRCAEQFILDAPIFGYVSIGLIEKKYGLMFVETIFEPNLSEIYHSAGTCLDQPPEQFVKLLHDSFWFIHEKAKKYIDNLKNNI